MGRIKEFGKYVRDKLFSSVFDRMGRIEEKTEVLSGQMSERTEVIFGQLCDIEKKIEALRFIRDEKVSLEATLVDERRDHIFALMRQRWNLIDRFDALRFAHITLPCPICETPIHTDTAEAVESTCLFQGGKLTRFVCPQCGVIFGPLKMLYLDADLLTEDYRQLYSVYSEGDTTQYEIKTFMQMNPSPGKVYLNYGCGAWSKSMQLLTEQGYTIYGYDAFVSNSESPRIITQRDELLKHRFDGIMTNNLIEHLKEPVADFCFLRSLLKDKDSLMVHSTECYEYRIEFSRFHLFFFTGDSVEYLCRRCGLESFAPVREEFDEILYMSKSFRLKEEETSRADETSSSHTLDVPLLS